MAPFTPSLPRRWPFFLGRHTHTGNARNGTVRTPRQHTFSTQDLVVGVQEIRGDVLCLRAPEHGTAKSPGAHPNTSGAEPLQYRAVLQVSSVNFALASATEQEAFLAGYAAFLNGLGYPIQTLARILPLDLTAYLNRLRDDHRSGVSGSASASTVFARLAAEHETFVRRLATEHKLLERRFYLIVPAEVPTNVVGRARGGDSVAIQTALGRLLPGMRHARELSARQQRFDASAQRLHLRVEDIVRQLTRVGIEARRLRGQELVDLYAECLATARTRPPFHETLRTRRWAVTGSMSLTGETKKHGSCAAPENYAVGERAENAEDAEVDGSEQDRTTTVEPTEQENENDEKSGLETHADHVDDERILRGTQSLPDVLAPAAVEVFRDGLRIDDDWARVLAITDYPRSVYPGWLATLIDFDEPFELALHVHPLASGAMIRTLSNRMVALHSSRLLDQRHGRLADPEREVAYTDVERLRNALQRGDERVFSFAAYLLIRGKTRRALDERCARIQATLDNLQLGSRPATLEHDLGLTSCLPEARDRLGRYRTFDTSSLATTFPFTSSSLSMPSGILYGVVPNTGSLVILDPFAPALENANQVVFAKSGAGKSYACKLQALRALLLGTEVYVVDPEDEYRPLCDAVGGQHIRLAPGSAQHINPFDLPPRPHTARSSATRLASKGGHAAKAANDPDANVGDEGEGETGESAGEDEDAGEELGDVLAEKVQSLHALLDLMLADHTPAGGASLSQREKGLLDRCLYETYRRVGITSHRRTHDRPAPLLRDLYEVVRSGVCGADEYGLADRLHRYVAGSLARLFSAPTDVALDNALVVFDVRDLDGGLRPLGLLLIADFVWTRVRQQRRPRLFLIDEAWSLIQHQEGGRFLAGLARRARKYYLGLITITQDVEDLLSSEWGRTVLSNSSIQLLMKQDSTTIESVSTAFRLSAGERQYVLGCHKGEGLLFARGGHVALRVEASPAEHELVTTDPRELAARAAQAEQAARTTTSRRDVLQRDDRNPRPQAPPGDAPLSERSFARLGDDSPALSHNEVNPPAMPETNTPLAPAASGSPPPKRSRSRRQRTVSTPSNGRDTTQAPAASSSMTPVADHAPSNGSQTAMLRLMTPSRDDPATRQAEDGHDAGDDNAAHDDLAPEVARTSLWPSQQLSREGR